MLYRFLNEAAEILSQNSDKAPDSAIVLALLIAVREHLEANASKSSYPVTSLYCDWMVHPNLDGRGAQNILGRVCSAMLGDPVAFNTRMNELLSLEVLRTELKQILADSNARSPWLTTFSGWRSFVVVLIRSLLVKPLKWKGAIPPGNHPDIFRLVPSDLSLLTDETFDNYGIPKSTCFWQVGVVSHELQPRGILTGPLFLQGFTENSHTGE